METLSIGELFDAMIKCNLDIWTKASRIKTFDGVPREIDPAKKVLIGQEIRQLNAKRSEIRWEIDKKTMKTPLNDCKINYTKKDK